MASFDNRPTVAMQINNTIFAVVHSKLPSRNNYNATLHIRDMYCSIDRPADEQA